MEKTTKKRVKHAILGVTSVALVAGVTSAITMAVLSDVKTKVNTFVGDPALSLQLYEPKWDGIDENGTDGQPDPGTPSNPDDPDLGQNKAMTYKPNVAIPKDPYLINTSGSDEYVAIRVTYQVHCDNGFWHTVSPAEFKQYFAKTQTTGGADYNTAAWLLDDTNNDDCEYYYYMNGGAFTKLLKYTNEDTVDETPALFDNVLPLDDLKMYTAESTGDWLMFNFTNESQQATPHYQPFKNNSGVDRSNTTLKDAVTDQEIRIVVGNTHGLPNFQILVEGAAIQTDNLDATNDAETIKGQLRSTFPALESHAHQ